MKSGHKLILASVLSVVMLGAVAVDSCRRYSESVDVNRAKCMSAGGDAYRCCRAYDNPNNCQHLEF